MGPTRTVDPRKNAPAAYALGVNENKEKNKEKNKDKKQENKVNQKRKAIGATSSNLFHTLSSPTQDEAEEDEDMDNGNEHDVVDEKNVIILKECVTIPFKTRSPIANPPSKNISTHELDLTTSKNQEDDNMDLSAGGNDKVKEAELNARRSVKETEKIKNKSLATEITELTGPAPAQQLGMKNHDGEIMEVSANDLAPSSLRIAQKVQQIRKDKLTQKSRESGITELNGPAPAHDGPTLLKIIPNPTYTTFGDNIGVSLREKFRQTSPTRIINRNSLDGYMLQQPKFSPMTRSHASRAEYHQASAPPTIAVTGAPPIAVIAGAKATVVTDNVPYNKEQKILDLRLKRSAIDGANFLIETELTKTNAAKSKQRQLNNLLQSHILSPTDAPIDDEEACRINFHLIDAEKNKDAFLTFSNEVKTFIEDDSNEFIRGAHIVGCGTDAYKNTIRLSFSDENAAQKAANLGIIRTMISLGMETSRYKLNFKAKLPIDTPGALLATSTMMDRYVFSDNAEEGCKVMLLAFKTAFGNIPEFEYSPTGVFLTKSQKGLRDRYDIMIILNSKFHAAGGAQAWADKYSEGINYRPTIKIRGIERQIKIEIGPWPAMSTGGCGAVVCKNCADLGNLTIGHAKNVPECALRLKLFRTPNDRICHAAREGKTCTRYKCTFLHPEVRANEVEEEEGEVVVKATGTPEHWDDL